jgi:type III restriction enzyme
MSEKSPILNNPYEEPRWHYSADLDGNLDYNKVLEGRRPYTATVGIAPNQPQSTFFNHDEIAENEPNAGFINSLREEVKRWRESGYPHVTRITRELLNYWFCNPERPEFRRLFFCQREAVETAVYLNEAADFDPNVGRYLLRQLEERQQSVHDDFAYVLPRTAFKMATGTGKTVVMAMLILYNYLNKREHVQDTRFADHFLLVAPGITIRDRLGVLFIDNNAAKAMPGGDETDYYHKRKLIPRNYEMQLGGLNACITIINYHQFEPKQYQGKKQSPMDGKLVYKSGEGMVKQQDKEEFTAVISRILGRMPKSKRILVINDEAHHCYLPKPSGTKASKEESDENQKAMVWYEGIRQMKLLGYKVQHVYDLSATPYYLKGSGYTEYSLFPWVVSDFGLVEAIESGLVKIPFLPSADDTTGLTDPVLRNIYEHISGDLPAKGQKAKKAEDRKNGKDKKQPEPAPNLPSLLNVAIDQFVKDYEEYDRDICGEGVAKNLFSTPPVFIVVCNNTSVSKEVFKMMAGYESVDADGNTVYVPGKYDVFSNYRDGMPLKKQPALLIDSAAIEDAGSVVSDEFKRIYSDEIQRFKRDYATLHGAGSADQLTDGDILREVVNSVGKPNTLGAHIRLVVSVSMLTEGWDANTVTHVCGVRAFGSQLLCEQVAGRALRRRSYELLPYNLNGEEIDGKDVRRYKPENIVWKFPPEYAHIIGVPFKTFKGGGSGVTPPAKPKNSVFAMEERANMEITFPNITGYRSQTADGRISADFTGVPKFRLNFNDVPTETTLSSAVDGEKEVVLKSDYRTLRDAQVVYALTRWLINLKYTDSENGRQFQLFAALKKVVQQWYDSQTDVIGGDGSPELRRLVVFWKPTDVVTSIYEGVRAAANGDERITAILNRYNPQGSTRHVHAATAKEVYPTKKSHVNCVVADTDSWEQICAKTLEQMAQVECYVKNAFLGFFIPYIDGTQEHRYVPDFIARVHGGKSGETVNLIIEISGFANDRTAHKDLKRYYTTQYWLPAANNLQTYGRWDFIEISDIDNIRALLTEKIKQL